MHCKKCGKEIASDSKFCKYCGEAQTGETNKKIVIQIPDIEVKTNPKWKRVIKKILLVLYILACLFVVMLVNSEAFVGEPIGSAIAAVLCIIILPLLVYIILLRLVRWIFK